MLHYNMRVRFTTKLAPPFAVQDVAGTVVGFELSPLDQYCYDIRGERQLKGGDGTEPDALGHLRQV